MGTTKIFLLVIAVLISGCSGSATPSTTTAAGTSAEATGTLTISPSSISLSEGQAYTFSASGGSGSGYTFTMASGGSVAGTVSTSGYFVAASGWTGTTYVILADSAGDETYATITVSGSSTSTTTGTTLSFVPSSVTLTEGEAYTFAATGGSGTGYVYSVPSGDEGTIDASTGYYVAPSAWTGTTPIEVSDSEGNVAYATVTITSSSSGTTSSTVLSMTGTLQTCEGIPNGNNVNNWQVNGTELRTIDDANNYTESPIYCMGLSIAGSIPSTATIQGISVGIYLINQSSAADGSLLQTMNLINGGTILGAAKDLNLAIPGNTATFPTFSEGASTDLWSAYLTPSVVNSSSFGINIQTYRGKDRLFTGDATDNMPQVTIYYTN
jgi:hypothetical protein